MYHLKRTACWALMLSTAVQASLFDFFYPIDSFYSNTPTRSVFCETSYRNFIDSEDITLHDHIFRFGAQEIPLPFGSLTATGQHRNLYVYYQQPTFWTSYEENSPEYQLAYTTKLPYLTLQAGGTFTQNRHQTWSDFWPSYKAALNISPLTFSASTEKKGSYPELKIQTVDTYLSFTPKLEATRTTYQTTLDFYHGFLRHTFTQGLYEAKRDTQPNTVSLNTPFEEEELLLSQTLADFTIQLYGAKNITHTDFSLYDSTGTLGEETGIFIETRYGTKWSYMGIHQLPLSIDIECQTLDITDCRVVKYTPNPDGPTSISSFLLDEAKSIDWKYSIEAGDPETLKGSVTYSQLSLSGGLTSQYFVLIGLGQVSHEPIPIDSIKLVSFSLTKKWHWDRFSLTTEVSQSIPLSVSHVPKDETSNSGPSLSDSGSGSSSDDAPNKKPGPSTAFGGFVLNLYFQANL